MRAPDLGLPEIARHHLPRRGDGLTNFSSRVRKYWIVTTVFGFIVAVLDVIALAIIGVPYSSLGACWRSSRTTFQTLASSSV